MTNPETSLAQSPEQFALAAVEEFIDSPQLETLTASFGYEDDPQTDYATRLYNLREFSNQNWDKRAGKERWEAGVMELTEEQEAAIVEFAKSAGMWDSTTPTLAPDLVAVLGGGNMSALLRQRYMLELGLHPEAVVLMGSNRKLGDAERKTVSGYAPEADTEAEMMEAGYEHLTDRKPVEDLLIRNPVERRHDNFFKDRNSGVVVPLDEGLQLARIKVYEGDGYPVFSITAPKREGELRPNTTDTYTLLETLAGEGYLGPDKTMTVVTTGLYVPFQRFDALKRITLKTGARVEVVGYGHEYAGIERKPQDLLQEINSAINSASWLMNELEA